MENINRLEKDQNSNTLTTPLHQMDRILLYDAYWPPFAPALTYCPKRAIDCAKKMGANTIRLGAMGKWALFPNDIIKPHPDLGDKDLVGETVALAKEANIHVVMYLSIGHALPQAWIHEYKPQWRFHLDDESATLPMRHFGGEMVEPPCVFGAYEQEIQRLVQTVADRYDPDAFYFDGPYQGWDNQDKICQCSACRKQFETATSLKLPTNHEVRQLERNTQLKERITVYTQWNRGKLLGLLKRLNEVIKRDRLRWLVMNRSAAAILGSDYERLVLSTCDGFLTETNRGGVEGFSIASHLGKVVWNYTNQHTPWPRLTSPSIELEAQREGFRALTQAGKPIVSYAGRLILDDQYAQPIADLFATVQKQAKQFKQTFSKKDELQTDQALPARMAQRCCVISPMQERLLEAGDLHTMSVNDSAYALYQSLRDQNYQSMMLPAIYLDQIDSFNEFELLAIPSNVRLTTKQINNLKKWVSQGGRLWLSSESVIDDTLGKSISVDDAFGDWIPISFTGQRISDLLPHYQWNDQPYEIYWQTTEKSILLPQTDALLIEPKKKTKVLARTVYWDDRQGEKQTLPAMVLGTYGQGTVLYCHSALEVAYDTHSSLMKETMGQLWSAMGMGKPWVVASNGEVMDICVHVDSGDWFIHRLGKSTQESITLTLNLPCDRFGKYPQIKQVMDIHLEKKLTWTDQTYKTNGAIEIQWPNVGVYACLRINFVKD